MAKNVGLGRLQDFTEQLHRCMQDEYDHLERERQKYLIEKAKMDELEKRIRSVQPPETERLKLNVDGKKFVIRKSSVRQNTFFQNLLSGTFAQPDSDGFYFIDRDPRHVQVIMTYLRDGIVDLSSLSEKELERIRVDAEFYMVSDLQAIINEYRSGRQDEGITLCSFNVGKAYNVSFNGVFFEINVRKDCKLHSISFVAGERRRIAGQAFHKEGPLDGPGQPRKIGEVAQQVEKGQLVSVTFSALPLTAGVHTIGVYASVYHIALCPRGDSQRQQHANIITMGKSYHTVDQKGMQKRAGEDEFDFCGELAVSFRD